MSGFTINKMTKLLHVRFYNQRWYNHLVWCWCFYTSERKDDYVDIAYIHRFCICQPVIIIIIMLSSYNSKVSKIKTCSKRFTSLPVAIGLLFQRTNSTPLGSNIQPSCSSRSALQATQTLQARYPFKTRVGWGNWGKETYLVSHANCEIQIVDLLTATELWSSWREVGSWSKYNTLPTKHRVSCLCLCQWWSKHHLSLCNHFTPSHLFIFLEEITLPWCTQIIFTILFSFTIFKPVFLCHVTWLQDQQITRIWDIWVS
jgi:hypothetical protein